MPTITPADALLNATSDLCETLGGDIPRSQYDKGMVDNFIAIINAKAKAHQIDKIPEERAQMEKAQAQRVAADTNKNEDVCLDEEDLEEALPKVDTPAANTRPHVGSGQHTVTREGLMTVVDISGVGYMLTSKAPPQGSSPRSFSARCQPLY